MLKGTKKAGMAMNLIPVYDALLPINIVSTSASVRECQVTIPMSPREAKRYNERDSCEQFNGRLKEGFRERHMMVRGCTKVTIKLMFGVVVLFTDQLLKLTGY